MAVETKLEVGVGEEQRAKLTSWVKVKVNQSKPHVSKAMRTFLKQLSNDVTPDEIPEGRLLSALERETLIRAQKLNVVQDLESLAPSKTSPALSGSLLAEWTGSERIPVHELAILRNGALSQAIGGPSDDTLADQLGFCLDMNGKEFPPVSGLCDDEKWVDVELEEEAKEDELKVSFMDEDDDWVLAVMLQLEQSAPREEEEEPTGKLDFRRAVVDGPPRPVSQDSSGTDDTEVAECDEDEETSGQEEKEEVEGKALQGGEVLFRSELVCEEEGGGRRDIGAWKKSRSVSEARRILQQTEKRLKQGKKGKGKRGKK